MNKPHISRHQIRQDGAREWVTTLRCCPDISPDGRIQRSQAFMMRSFRAANHFAVMHCRAAHGAAVVAAARTTTT